MKNRTPHPLKAWRAVVPGLGALAAAWLAAAPVFMPVPALAHEVDCAGRQGIALARCERHAKMKLRCGPVAGEAHFACDREFLLANPLECTALSGADQRACQAERAAFRQCEPRAGRDFMACVSEQIRANPAG